MKESVKDFLNATPRDCYECNHEVISETFHDRFLAEIPGSISREICEGITKEFLKKSIQFVEEFLEEPKEKETWFSL